MFNRRLIFPLVDCLFKVPVLLVLVGISSAFGGDLRKNIGYYSVVNAPASRVGFASENGASGKFSWQKANSPTIKGAVLPLGDMSIAGIGGTNPGVIIYKIDKEKGGLQGVGALQTGRFYESCQAVPNKKGEYRIVKAKNSVGEPYNGSVTLKKTGATYQVTHRRTTKAGMQEWNSTGIVRNGNLICGWGSLAIYEPSVDHPGFLLGKIFASNTVEEQVLLKMKNQPVAAGNLARLAPPVGNNPGVPGVAPRPAVPAVPAPRPGAPVVAAPRPALPAVAAARPGVAKPKLPQAVVPPAVPANVGIQVLGRNFLFQANMNLGMVANGFANKAIPAPAARLQVNVIRANVRRFRQQLRGMVAAVPARRGRAVGAQFPHVQIQLASYAQAKAASDDSLSNAVSMCDALDQQCAALDAYLAQANPQNAQAFDKTRKLASQQLEKTYGPLHSVAATPATAGKSAATQATGARAAQIGSLQANRPGTKAIASPRSPSRVAMIYAQLPASAIPAGGSEKLSLGTLAKCLLSELDSGMGLIADCRQAGALDNQTASDLCTSCRALSSNSESCFTSLCASGSFSRSDISFCLDCANCCQTCFRGCDALAQFCMTGKAGALDSFDKLRSEYQSQASSLCGVSKQVAALNQNSDGLSVDDDESLAAERQSALAALTKSVNGTAPRVAAEAPVSSPDSLFGEEYTSGPSEEGGEISLSQAEESFFNEAEQGFSEPSEAGLSEMEFEETPVEFESEKINLSEVASQAEEMVEMESSPSELGASSEDPLSIPESSPSSTESEASPSPSEPPPESEPTPSSTDPSAPEEATPGSEPSTPEPEPSEPKTTAPEEPAAPAPGEPEPTPTEPSPSESSPSESESTVE